MVTTIQIDENIKSKLDKLKIHHRETYNELISRLVNVALPKDYNKEGLIETIEVLSDPKLMKGIAESLEEERKGKTGTTLKELRKELGL